MESVGTGDSRRPRAVAVSTAVGNRSRSASTATAGNGLGDFFVGIDVTFLYFYPFLRVFCLLLFLYG